MNGIVYLINCVFKISVEIFTQMYFLVLMFAQLDITMTKHFAYFLPLHVLFLCRRLNAVLSLIKNLFGELKTLATDITL